MFSKVVPHLLTLLKAWAGVHKAFCLLSTGSFCLHSPHSSPILCPL